MDANGDPFRLCIIVSYAFFALRWPRDGAALLDAPGGSPSRSEKNADNGLFHQIFKLYVG